MPWEGSLAQSVKIQILALTQHSYFQKGICFSDAFLGKQKDTCTRVFISASFATIKKTINKPNVLNKFLPYCGTSNINASFKSNEGGLCSNKATLGLPGGLVVENPPFSSEDVGSIPGPETKVPLASKQLSPPAVTTGARSTARDSVHCNERSSLLLLRPNTDK